MADIAGISQDPGSLSRETILVITREINTQWMRSKCDPDLPRSRLLTESLESLRLTKCAKGEREADLREEKVTPEEALGIIMPQYETLWRVVLLTFVTAYHRQGRKENVLRGEDVPSCLGNSMRESEALKLAKVRHVI